MHLVKNGCIEMLASTLIFFQLFLNTCHKLLIEHKLCFSESLPKIHLHLQEFEILICSKRFRITHARHHSSHHCCLHHLLHILRSSSKINWCSPITNLKQLIIQIKSVWCYKTGHKEPGCNIFNLFDLTLCTLSLCHNVLVDSLI